MAMSIMDTQSTMQAYSDALLGHGDFAQYLSEEVVATLEGVDPQIFRGREAVRGWIEAAHSLGEVKARDLFACERHAAGEFEFVRKDGVVVPYSVIYDVADGQITALRLFFTGPVQA
jgi:hypothetical protein